MTLAVLRLKSTRLSDMKTLFCITGLCSSLIALTLATLNEVNGLSDVAASQSHTFDEDGE